MNDFKSKFIDGTDAAEYQAMIAPLIHEAADVVSETDEIPLEWNDLWSTMKQQPHPWILTTENMYTRMLEVLPPQDMGSGGFLVGEPEYHNKDDEAVYACFTSNHDQTVFQARYMTQREFNQWKLIHR
jgi:hypothetical protein